MTRGFAATLIALVLALWVGAPAPAAASCVTCTCTVSATPLAFGAINPLNAGPIDTSGAVTVTCSPIGLLIGYNIRLSKGTSGTYASRTLTSGARTLSYNIYTDAAHTQVWGDGSGASVDLPGGFLISVGNTSLQSPIYARIASAAGAYGGAYTDTITVSVIW